VTSPYKTAMKSPPAKILIVGQGLAGTVLGWSLSRAGLDWRMIDAGHATAASRVAAGIINPVTGQRWVKTWLIDELWPMAWETYRAIENDLGVPLWRELTIRRYWRTEKEHRTLLSKIERGVLAPWVQSVDANSCVLAPAGRVNVPLMLTTARARWLAEGRLIEGRFDWANRAEHDGWVIDCTGAAAREGPFASSGFAISKGEVLRARIEGLADGEIPHRGHWVLPEESGEAWIGATHEPGVDDVTATPAAREALLRSARNLGYEKINVTAHLVGLRLAARNMRPLIGVHPTDPRLGILGALGSKGVLYAPWLAQQWVEHITKRYAFSSKVSAVFKR